MGALHERHRALLRAARRRERSVLATLFVNRTQFSEPSDYTAYPRDEAADLAAFKACGVGLVFAPSVEEMYPEGLRYKNRPGTDRRRFGRGAATRALRGRRHGGGQALQPHKAGARLLRSKGLATDPGDRPHCRRT